MPEKNVVIIGSGVAGLTTALLLSKKPGYRILVAAKHMPGDYDIEHASPWAGANYMPVSVSGTELAKWDKNRWGPLADLAANHPEAGVHFQECEIHRRTKDLGFATADWFAELLLCHGFTSVCINTAIYLPWLVSQCLANGVIFKRAIFEHILDAASGGLHPSGNVDLIVNCMGLMASKLGGVQDTTVVPARGQIVIVRNEADMMLDVSGTDNGDGEACYVMARAAGRGTILGGSYQKGSWESEPDPNPHHIIRNGVGLRPVRAGGTRIEKEKIDGVWVVHNYGAGGSGYQSSYGCAKVAMDLIERAFESRARL
ncbi:D-amino-acid oxidase [Aspergillus insuetus]